MCRAVRLPPQNSARTTNLGGSRAPVNARLVKANNQRGDEHPPLIKVSLYFSRSTRRWRTASRFSR
ncbi:hypothetical protein FT638_12945 [Bacillus cereus]|nr:hypothetical protein [Bacillus cereus]